MQIFESISIKVPRILKEHLLVFQRAFTHKSYCKENYVGLDEYPTELQIPPLLPFHYENLEFAGDSILKSSISILLMDLFDGTNKTPGFFTLIRAKIEKTDSLAHFSRKLGLPEYLMISATEESNRMRENSRIQEDIFESFVYSVFYLGSGGLKHIEKGYSLVNKFVNRVIFQYFDWDLSKDLDWISKLSEYSIKRFGRFDRPKLVNKIGTTPVLFTLSWTHPEEHVSIEAIDMTKKLAELKICQDALIMLWIHEISSLPISTIKTQFEILKKTHESEINKRKKQAFSILSEIDLEKIRDRAEEILKN